MKVVTFKKPGRFGAVDIKPEAPRLLPDETAAQLNAMRPGLVELGDVDGNYNRYAGYDLTEKSLLLVRNGGFGDLLFLTPLIRYLDDKYDHDGIAVTCGRKYEGLFLRNSRVRRIHTYPVRLKDFVSYDYQLCFEGTIENSKDPELHAVDLFARHAGIHDLDDRTLEYEVDRALANKAKNILRYDLGVKPDDVKIAVHLRSSSLIRNYPPENSLRVAAALGIGGAKVFLLGTKRDWDEIVGVDRETLIKLKNVTNLCGRFKSMDGTAAFLSKMDLLIGPDSALVHVAGALRLPTVALYGPFPGAVRTKYYPGCLTLEGKKRKWLGLRSCSPCFIHGHKPCPKAKRDGISRCLRKLKPETVVRAALEVLAEKGRTDAKA
ncbi:MAG TPA: glycosyltransferase family 9 protein [bacterium]|nr:glycosyltransferase family 9 protein [bacterium]